MQKKVYSLVLCFILFCLTNICRAQNYGDVNSDNRIDIVDALMIARYSVGMMDHVDADFLVKGDVNLDKSVTIVDALIIAQYYVGLYDSLPLAINTPTPVNTAPPRPTRPITSVTPDPFHVDNPFKEAAWYVDPIWSEKARKTGGEAVAKYPTAIWMDRIGAITDGIGLRGHLDAALAQDANLITVVIYDVPDRNCGAQSSSSFYFKDPADKYERYTKEYIDPIAAIFADPAYKSLRIVTIVEPYSLAYLVTGLADVNCREAAGVGGYRDCIVYALNSFGEVSNVYSYLSAAWSSWLGWDSNNQAAAQLFVNTLKRTKKGLKSIDGFAVNIGMYNPVEEPYLPDCDLKLAKGSVRSALFYEWNFCLDEMDYIQRLNAALKKHGFSEDLSFVIDTSMNGWGGPNRPSGVSSSPDLERYVNESRIDRRQHRGNYCNIKGAGLGYRPQAEPAPLVDAYLWIWPPGESLGVSTPNFVQDPNDPSKRFEKMCDPHGKSSINYKFGTDAMGPAPHRGRWFPDYFKMLMKNAYPPIE